MKIFIDNLLLVDKGGIYIYFQELFKFLNNKNCSYHVDFFDIPSKPIYPKNYSIKKRDYLERIRKCNVASEFDIFHSSYYRIPRKKNIKVVTTVHDFTHQKYVSGLRSYINLQIKMRAIRRSDVIICISENTKKDLLRHYKPRFNQQIFVIYNGISNDYKKLFLDDFSYENYFLYVGHRVNYKNWDLALKLLEEQKDFKLIVVGGDLDEKKFFKNIKTNIRDRVIFKGFITNSELNNLYNKAFCLFYPSSYEGFGIPVLEAMASGCPVIANDECKSVVEVAKETPLYFNKEENNYSYVFNTLKNINREKKVKEGLKFAKNFSWKKNFDQVYKIYQSLYNDQKI